MPNILFGISQIAENESILWVSRLGHDFFFIFQAKAFSIVQLASLGTMLQAGHGLNLTVTCLRNACCWQ